MEEEIPKQQQLAVVQQKDQNNLQPLEKEIIPKGEHRFLPQQLEENQLHHDLKNNRVAITNKTKKLKEVNNINVNDGLSFVVDQLMEIAFKVGDRRCAMTTHFTKLQKEKDALAKRLVETKSQSLNQAHKQELEQ